MITAPNVVQIAAVRQLQRQRTSWLQMRSCVMMPCM